MIAKPMKTLELHYSMMQFLIIAHIPLFLAGLPQRTRKVRLHILATHLWFGQLLEIINSSCNKMDEFMGQFTQVVPKRLTFANRTSMKYALVWYQFNRLFPSCLLPLLQSQCRCETIDMIMYSP